MLRTRLDMREKLMFIIPGAICAMLVGLWTSDCGGGIVGLEGYEHAVALCEGGEDEPLREDETYGKAHMWKKNGIMYVVNEGHLRDTQVTELVALAEVECAQYLED